MLNIKNNITAKNTVILYLIMVLNTGLGYVITKLNTTYLSIDDYGKYSFFLNIILFIRVLLSGGVFESGARLTALKKKENPSLQIWGIVIIVTISLSIIMVILQLMGAEYSNNFFEINIGDLLKKYAFISFPVIFQLMLLAMLRGDGRIRLLSGYIISPRIIYLLLLIILIYFNNFTLENSILGFLASILCVSLVTIIVIKPAFSRLSENFKFLLTEVKEYGKHIYITNLFSSSLIHLDKIILAFFVNASELGLYALAYTLTYPLSYFSSALSNASFKNYVHQQSLSKKHIIATIFYALIVSTLFIIFRKFIIVDLFGEQFKASIPTFIILVVAFTFNAVSVPFTMFFKAQKKGIQVRNITVSAQTLYLILNVILIPYFGIIGAALSVLIAYLVDLILYIILHIKLFSNSEDNMQLF